MKRIWQVAVVLVCLLLPVWAWAEGEKLPIQDVHRVHMKQTNEFRSNDGIVFTCEITTVLPQVNEEINGIAKAYASEMKSMVLKPRTDGGSRLEVTICHSRTGLTWMSFMVQGRYTYEKAVKEVRFTTRTYDMVSGQQLMLTDIFPAESEAWELLQQSVREGILAYYPDLTPDAEALEAACTREAVEKMDFTLHGMSLVLHLHAEDFYPEKEQLIEIPLYYPDIRPMMTEKAQVETDNLTYYKTVALTYDDGPSGWVTREILNVLAKTGVRATFFLVGDRVERFSHYALREHDEGHAIASHNFHHDYAHQLTKEELLKMAKQVDDAHERTIGIAPKYARAPGGSWQGMAKAGVGWPLIQWTAEARDWEGSEGPDSFETAMRIVGLTKDGGIILMHDLKRNSIDASEQFITMLQERGYMFLTVDELFIKDGVELQPDTAYWRCTNGVTTE